MCRLCHQHSFVGRVGPCAKTVFSGQGGVIGRGLESVIFDFYRNLVGWGGVGWGGVGVEWDGMGSLPRTLAGENSNKGNSRYQARTFSLLIKIIYERCVSLPRRAATPIVHLAGDALQREELPSPWEYLSTRAHASSGRSGYERVVRPSPHSPPPPSSPRPACPWPVFCLSYMPPPYILERSVCSPLLILAALDRVTCFLRNPSPSAPTHTLGACTQPPQCARCRFVQ